MEHSNSRTFKGLDFFSPKFKHFQGLLKDPINPDSKLTENVLSRLTGVEKYTTY